MKRFVATLLALLMILCLPASSLAYETMNDRIMSIRAYYQGEYITDYQKIYIESSAGDYHLIVELESILPSDENSTTDPDTSKLEFYYIWDFFGEPQIARKFEGADYAYVSIPCDFVPFSSHTLQIKAVINDKVNGYVGNSNIITLDVYTTKEIAVSTALSILVENQFYVSRNSKLMLSGLTTSDHYIWCVGYKWDDGEVVRVDEETAIIEIPDTFEYGSVHTLKVQARAHEGTLSDVITYNVIITD